MLTNRMKISIVAGALLGVVCILGAQLRSGFEREVLYLFAFWYNRLLMGVVIGFAKETQELKRALWRGAIIGLLVSFAFYSSTVFEDAVGFAAGIVYGVIIEYAAYRFADRG
ncbi:hypothetical protein [Trichococcus sp.]|uniref:hypothetical protein n=1 Tax=Trichococcus sp. TaxID=1985464 RepID=UPI003C7C42CA